MRWAECLRLTTAELGRLGEDLATAFLVRRQIKVISRNVKVGVGEIDLIVSAGGWRTAVEVRSIRRTHETSALAIDAFDPAKAIQVKKLARAARCRRIDLISVSFHAGGIDLHWVPEVV